MEAQKLPCPEYRKFKNLKKIRALEEGNIVFDITPTATLLTNTDTSQKTKLQVPFAICPQRTCIVTGDYSDCILSK